LQRLVAAARRQGLLPEAGCPACRDRRKESVVVRGRSGDNGEVNWDWEGPPPCAVCGEVTEEVVEIIEQVVATRDQAQAWLRGERADRWG
jgi:hypothetical protein